MRAIETPTRCVGTSPTIITSISARVFVGHDAAVMQRSEPEEAAKSVKAVLSVIPFDYAVQEGAEARSSDTMPQRSQPETRPLLSIT